MPNIKKIARFGTLTLFENWIPDRVGDDKKDTSFISLKSNLPTVSSSYQWTDNDVAYARIGDYIATGEPSTINSQQSTLPYPFRSLFTKRSMDEREFDVEENEDSIIIRSLLLGGPGSVTAKKKVNEQKNPDEEDRIDDPRVQIQINKVNLRQIYHMLFPSDVVASENDAHKPNNNPDERINDDKFYGIDIHNQRERSSSQMAAISDTIPSNTFVVNTVDQSPRPENTVGNITNDPTQPAERLVNNPDNTRVADRDFSRDITTTLSGDAFRVNIIIPKADALVYDSTKSADLTADKVQLCGVLRDGTATAKVEKEAIKPDQHLGTIPGIKLSNDINFLRFTSRNQRGCLSFGAGNLPHRDGYLVAVENRHIAGRPMLFSLINQTAKHVELEVYLNKSKVDDWQTDYFVLPPLAPDGLGYTVYLSNDAIGRQESINDIASIKFYRIPYLELVTLHSANTQPQGPALSVDVDIVSHPNPAYYEIRLQTSDVGSKTDNATLILSQSFDNGWKVYTINTNNPIIQLSNYPIKTWLFETLPFLFGTEIKDHVLVNNWENGWVIDNQTIRQKDNKKKSDLSVLPSQNLTVVIFFLPQLLQWLGFFLLPIPFLVVLLKRNR